MADKQSFVQIAESIQHISFLKDFPNVSEDERGELEEHLKELASRQEAKFDSIIGLIKKCDAYIAALQNEMDEIKTNLDAWKKNKEKITNIIKFAYQQNLIDGTPTGIKYQATIKRVKPRLADNFGMWTENEISEFGLQKTTTVTRIKDGTVVDVKEEKLPDKEMVRQALAQDQGNAPLASQLIPALAFVYERRKRLTS